MAISVYYNQQEDWNGTIADGFNSTSSVATTEYDNNNNKFKLSYGILAMNTNINLDDLSNLKTVNATSDNDNFYIDFTVPSKIEFYGYGSQNDMIVQSFAHKYVADKLELSIYGDKRVIKLNETSANTPNIENSKTIANIDSSEIQQSETKVENVKITTQIKNNILNDYKDGIANGNIDLFCGDYYNSLNTKVIDWEDGELIQPNKIIYFENDLKSDATQRYWRVTGRKFTQNGSPKKYIEVMEIAKIY